MLQLLLLGTLLYSGLAIPIPLSCIDSTTHIFENDDAVDVGCSWLTDDPIEEAKRMAEYCPRPYVKYMCADTCNTCADECEDNPVYVFRQLILNVFRRCSWITEVPSQIDIRRKGYCDNVGIFCPDACGYCPEATSSSPPSIQPSMKSEQPSASPSTDPSWTLTYAPSLSPSNQPSESPSSTPSSVPSDQLSGKPTVNPSSTPSLKPSYLPTDRPSAYPSSVPSGQPTLSPSLSPTNQPSKSPSSTPSSAPSGPPSNEPTSMPSLEPSKEPSSEPTGQPSVDPTSAPSVQPTSSPSSLPTTQPSDSPSSKPSSVPTSQPSIRPTAMPSLEPSEEPSSAPTGQPSLTASSTPSLSPTSEPSDIPSSSPSSQPTSVPSMIPTAMRSLEPSREPSSNPTSQPSVNPTTTPSSTPSDLPSVPPTSVPTNQPSAEPTKTPSFVPSIRPTSIPSSTPSFLPQTCDDAPLSFWQRVNLVITCSDFNLNRCNQSYYASHCPATCGKCSEEEYKCADSEAIFVYEDKLLYCEWLSDLDQSLIDERCADDNIKLTCRSTCAYCGGVLINFDDVSLTDPPYYAEYTNDAIYMDNIGAFHGEDFQSLFPEFPGIAKSVVSEANAGAIYFPEEFALMVCPEGTFDMISLYVNSITGVATSLEIVAYDEFYQFVDEAVVLLTNDEASSVTLPSSFENIRAVSISNDDEVAIGLEDIELFINSPCFVEGASMSGFALDFIGSFASIPDGRPKTFLGFNYDAGGDVGIFW